MRSVIKISRQAIRLKLDGYLPTTASVFCAAQSLAIILRATAGFGKRLSTLSVDKVDRNEKATMAADILYPPRPSSQIIPV